MKFQRSFSLLGLNPTWHTTTPSAQITHLNHIRLQISCHKGAHTQIQFALLQNSKSRFHLLLLLSSNSQVCLLDLCCCSQTVYWYQRRFVKTCVCAAGMAVRLNMSPASLCSHVHKSTYNDCKHKTHYHPEKSTAAFFRPHILLHTSRGHCSQLITDDCHNIRMCCSINMKAFCGWMQRCHI